MSSDFESSPELSRAEQQAIAQHFLGRNNPQRLAQRILGKHNPQRLAQSILGRQNCQKQARTLLGKTRIEKSKQNRKQHERRQARGTPALPYGRCKDWMIHRGDVHYVRNSSSFHTYTKIDTKASGTLGLPEVRALGIGTVYIDAQRPDGEPGICRLTLHDVLHIPTMPCNGIAYKKLADANLDIRIDAHGDLVARNPSQVPMFRGEFKYESYRLVLDQQPSGESPLDDGERSVNLNIIAKNTAKVARLGRAGREIADIERQDGFRPWKDGVEVEC